MTLVNAPKMFFNVMGPIFNPAEVLSEPIAVLDVDVRCIQDFGARPAAYVASRRALSQLRGYAVVVTQNYKPGLKWSACIFLLIIYLGIKVTPRARFSPLFTSHRFRDAPLSNKSCVHPPGSDVVEWLFHHIEGFSDRREARKYASNLLKAGFIRHTVNKITFSEQCYYVFGDLSDCENCE